MFRYTMRRQRAPEHNPNGSLNSIAGICNRARNVVGLMPHPERAVELRSAAPTAGSCSRPSSMAAALMVKPAIAA